MTETPCQRKGYRVGDLLCVTSLDPSVLKPKSLVELSRDDRSGIPEVGLLIGATLHAGTPNRSNGKYIDTVYCKLEKMVKVCDRDHPNRQTLIDTWQMRCLLGIQEMEYTDDH